MLYDPAMTLEEARQVVEDARAALKIADHFRGPESHRNWHQEIEGLWRLLNRGHAATAKRAVRKALDHVRYQRNNIDTYETQLERIAAALQ